MFNGFSGFIMSWLVVFTNAHLNTTRAVGAIKFNPGSIFKTKIKSNRTSARYRYIRIIAGQGLQIVERSRSVG